MLLPFSSILASASKQSRCFETSLSRKMVNMAPFTRLPMALVFMLLLIVVSVNATSNSSIFTPAAMLSAPRRGTALPNSDGTLALYTTSTYNFTTHCRKYGLWVMDLSIGSSTLLSNSSAVGEAHWLGDGTEIIWLLYEDDGSTSFQVGDATKPDAE